MQKKIENKRTDLFYDKKRQMSDNHETRVMLMCAYYVPSIFHHTIKFFVSMVTVTWTY